MVPTVTDTNNPTCNQPIQNAPDGGGFYVAAVYADDVQLIDGQTTLTFPGDVSTNPDLQYFKAGDVVQNNIEGTDNPNWNETRVWSEIIQIVTIASTSDIKNLFDGNLNTGIGSTNTQAGSVFQIIIPADIPGSTISAQAANSVNQMNFSLDGVNYVNKGETIPLPEGERTLYIKGMGSNTATCGAIYIDGLILVDPTSVTSVKVISTGYPNSNTMIVDGGEWLGSDGSSTDGVDLGWNQDEVWSDGASTTAMASGRDDVSNIFNGILNPSSNNAGLGPTGGDIGVVNDLSIPVGVNDKVQFAFTRTNVTNTSSLQFWVTSDTAVDTSKTSLATAPIASSATFQLYDMPSGFSGNSIKEIRLQCNTGSSVVLHAIYINGQLLVDSGIAGAPTPNGDTSVTYQTNGGQGSIVSVNTDNNTILLTNTGDGDNRWIIGTTDSAGNAGNSGETGDAAGAKDFYVAGPISYDRPLLTADVELLSSNFATTPDNADSLKNIVWELNGATQDAGLSNPYKPTLSTDTTYTVRVKHQGNSLEDSAWSTSTTFTTGATRNLYTYYKERVELLEARLAGIEADEIVDDATDVTLLTAFANLVERVEALENP